jgi:hypothetical protein
MPPVAAYSTYTDIPLSPYDPFKKNSSISPLVSSFSDRRRNPLAATEA